MNRVDLRWIEPEHANLTHYIVEVVGEDRLTRFEAPTVSASMTGLRNGVSYEFVVYAVNDNGRSEASAAVRATPTTGAEGEVAGLIVAFEDGVSVSEGQESVPGEAVVDEVDLAVDEEIADGIHTVDLSEAVSLTEAKTIAQELASDGAVAWAEPDQFVFTSAITTDVPDDAEYADSQWNLWDTFGIGLGDGNASMTSAYSQDAGAGATVAVIDTGVVDHPDLRNQLVPGFDFVSDPAALAAVRTPGGDTVPFDGDGQSGWDDDPTDPGDWRGVAPVRDSSWHGTHIAGVIAAQADNAEGVVGVVPGARIQPIRALSWRGGLMSDIASAITWASGGAVDGAPTNATPADVINLSFAVEGTCSIALQNSISDAVARGSVVVAAAGNAASDVAGFAPANCADVIAVGATGRDGKRAPYSNFGDGIDVSAPGGAGDGSGGVLSTSNDGTTLAETASYRASEGTSIAAAHVSSAAAFLAGADQSLSPAQIRMRIADKDSVRSFAEGSCDADPAKTCGEGILDLAQIAAAGVPGIDVNLTTSVSGTDTLIADGSTVATGSTVTVGSAALLNPGVGDREIRTTLDSKTAYTSGSAVAPEGWTINYSTDSGSNWSSSEPSPASSVTDVRATKSGVAAGLIEGTSQIYSSETTSQIPSSSFSASTGGDGWDVFFSEDKVYNIFHHNTSALVLDCHLIATGARCTEGYTKSFSGYIASGQSSAWVDRTSGNIYAITTQTSTARVGALCIDVSSAPTSCGFTTLGSVPATTSSYLSTSPPSWIGRKLFAIDSYTQQLVCFDAATDAACTNSPVTIADATTSLGHYNRTMTVGDTLMVKTPTKVHCYTAALEVCGGFPVSISSQSGYAPLAQHADADGTPDGVCFYATSSTSSCVDTSGTIRSDWTSPFNAKGLSNTSYWFDGTQSLGNYYFAQTGTTTISCFDYSTNDWCSGFSNVTDTTIGASTGLMYAVRVDPSNPRCLWLNSDRGLIRNFNALTGALGCDDVPTITLQPNQFAPRYACTTTAGITEWTELRLVSTTGGGTASSITLTVRTATGDVVSGWSGVPVTVGGSLDMTGLDPTVSGSRPTFSFDFSGVTGTISTAVIALDYKGKGPELCVDTVATSSSPPEDASITGTLTETLTVEESVTQTRTFTIGTATSVVEQTVPGAPTITSSTGLNTTADITFTPPTNTGGLSITSYSVSTDGGSSWSTASEVANGDGSYTITVTDLTPGTTYSMAIAAVNDMGRGASDTVSVLAQYMAIDTLEDTPVNQGPLTLASTTSGGLPLTYTSSSTGICTVSGTTVTLVAEGLCELVAHQAGDSTATPVILPADIEGSFTVLEAYYAPTAPGAPTGLTLTPSNGQIALSWTAPTSDGNSDITDYIVQYKLGGSWIPFADGTSTATSALMAGLTNGTEYTFRVAAVNAVGTSSYSSTASATPATTPGAPTSLAASLSSTTLSVTWVAPTTTGGSAITDYLVEYKLSSDGDWTTFTDGVSTTASASITGLTAGQDYDVQVTSINAIGEGGTTSTVNLTLTPGSTQMALSWSAPSSPGGTITDYEMQYRTSSSDPWTTFVDGVSATTGGTVTGLTNGTQYYFRVATIVDGTTTSSYTSVVPGTPRTTPDAPSVTATPGNRQIALSWSAPGNGGSAITDYVIQYKATSGSTWSTLVDGTSTTTSATVTSLTNGTSFDFRVASTNVVGTGSYSTSTSATPYTTPDAPTAVSATAGAGQVSLTWTAPTDTGGSVLTNYVVQYKVAGAYTWSTASRTASTTAAQTVTGLTNGTAYVFQVAAVTAAGTGTYATAVSATPVTTPGVPLSLAVSVSGTTASVTWTAPTSNGGSAITDYEVDYKLTTAASWTSFTHSASASTSATLTGLTGLTSGARYDVRVRTVTAIGTSSYTSTAFPALSSGGGSGGTTTETPRSGETTTVPEEPIDPPAIPNDDEVMVLIDGVLMSLAITPPSELGPEWQVKGNDFSLSFTPQRVAGTNQLVGDTSGMRAPRGGWIKVFGDGYQNDSQVKVYAIPRPKYRMSWRAVTNAVFLGSVNVRADGTFDVQVTLPESLSEGDYVLQVNGVSPEATVRSVNMGLEVFDVESPSVGDSTSRPKSVTRVKSQAFFAARSAKFSPLGKKRLRKMVRDFPRTAQSVDIRIVGASIGMPTKTENVVLASRRADRLVSYLLKRGISGTFTVKLSAARGTGPNTTPDAYDKRKRQYTTATITYAATNGVGT